MSLPERSAITFCDLEGLTHQEAADQLGWPLGTVKARVSRGRDRLRSRLARRGVTLSASTIASTLTGETLASAVIARSLVVAITRAALAIAAGRAFTAGLMSPSVYHLTQGAARAMIATKFKVLAIALAAGTVLTVPGVVAYQAKRGSESSGSGRSVPSAALAQPGDRTTKVDSAKEVDLPDPGTTGNGPPLETIQSPGSSAQVASDKFNPPPSMPEIGDISLEKKAEMEATNQAVLKKLKEPIPFVEALLEEAKNDKKIPSLERLIQVVQSTTKDPAIGLPRGIPIELQTASRRIAQLQPINLPRLASYKKSTPFQTILDKEMKAFGLKYEVKFGTLYIGFDNEQTVLNIGNDVYEQPSSITRELDDEKRNEMIRAKLDRIIPLKFPKQVSLNELVAYIKKATRDGDEKPIPIYVDPRVFGDQPFNYAKSVEDPAIVIDLDDVPLRTSLRLALIQMHLEYAVSGGLLIIGGTPVGNPGGGGGGFTPPTGLPNIYQLVEPRDRMMGGMGGGFR